MNNPIKHFQNWVESENPTYEVFLKAFLKLPDEVRMIINNAQYCVACPYFKEEGFNTDWWESINDRRFTSAVFNIASNIFEEYITFNRKK